MNEAAAAAHQDMIDAVTGMEILEQIQRLLSRLTPSVLSLRAQQANGKAIACAAAVVVCSYETHVRQDGAPADDRR